MKKEELNEIIKEFKEDHLNTMTKTFKETGYIMPTIAMLTIDSSDKTGIVLAPIDISGKDTRLGKEDLLEIILPKLKEEIDKKNLEVVCFSFSTEAYMKKLSLDKDLSKKDPKELMKLVEKLESEDTLVIMFETNTNVNKYVYNIIKDGKVINSEGDLIDKFDLTDFRDLEENSTTTKPEFLNVFKS